VAKAGGFGQFGGELTYSLQRTRVAFGASAATSGRYFGGLETRFVGAHNASVGGSIQLGRSTRLLGSHGTAYQPYMTFGLFPQLFEPALGMIEPASLDLRASREDYFRHFSTIELSQQLSRRSALTASYGRTFSDFSGSSRDFVTQAGNGRLTVGLARGLGLRLGYGYMDGQYAPERGVQGHTADVGIDFNRALSFSRRTTLSFATGSSAIEDRNRTYYRVTGNARLVREIGRTWNASLVYDRNIGFIETFPEPFFYDSLTLGYGGMVNRRVQFFSRVGASIGDVGLSGQQNRYDTYTGTVGANVGLTRNLAFNVNYSYYRYSFDEGVPLPPGVGRELGRHSVSTRLSVWVPLLHRTRRPDASR
jgi:hypothetical protein